MERPWAGADRVVEVTDGEIEDAMRDSRRHHDVAEAAAAAALLRERDRIEGRTVAVVLTGGNVGAEVLAPVLARVR